jgi:hypothetical protein
MMFRANAYTIDTPYLSQSRRLCCSNAGRPRIWFNTSVVIDHRKTLRCWHSGSNPQPDVTADTAFWAIGRGQLRLASLTHITLTCYAAFLPVSLWDAQPGSMFFVDSALNTIPANGGPTVSLLPATVISAPQKLVLRRRMQAYSQRIATASGLYHGARAADMASCGLAIISAA